MITYGETAYQELPYDVIQFVQPFTTINTNMEHKDGQYVFNHIVNSAGYEHRRGLQLYLLTTSTNRQVKINYKLEQYNASITRPYFTVRVNGYAPSSPDNSSTAVYGVANDVKYGSLTYNLATNRNDFHINFYGMNNAKLTILSIETNAGIVYPLEKPNLLLNSTLTKISATWSESPNATHYEIYLDNQLHGTTASTNYIIESLSHNRQYNILLKAINSDFLYSPSEVSASIKTLNYFTGKPSANSEIGITWAKVYWNEVQDTDYYEIQLENQTVISTKQLEHIFDNLVSNTTYTIKLRQVSLSGEYSDWIEITFTTLAPPEYPPSVPKISLSNETMNSFEISIASNNAESYEVFISNKLVATITDTVYLVENLSPSSVYQIKIIAYNEFGKNQGFAVGTTLSIKNARVTQAHSSSLETIDPRTGAVSVNPRQQQLNWKGENVNHGYAVYVDGIHVGNFDDMNAIIDLDSIEGLEDKDEYNYKIIPLDENGEAYEFTGKLTGSSSLSVLVNRMSKGQSTIKSFMRILVLSILGLAILFFGASWIYLKMKLELATKDPAQAKDYSPNVVYLHGNDKKSYAKYNTELDKVVSSMEKWNEKLYKDHEFHTRLVQLNEAELREKANQLGLKDNEKYTDKELRYILSESRDKEKKRRDDCKKQKNLLAQKTKSNKSFGDIFKESLKGKPKRRRMSKPKSEKQMAKELQNKILILEVNREKGRI